MTHARRLPPDIPIFGEMGLPGFSFSAWYALFAPKGTLKEIIERLNAATVEAFADPAVRSRLIDLEICPREQQTPEALDALVKADAKKWWPAHQKIGDRRRVRKRVRDSKAPPVSRVRYWPLAAVTSIVSARQLSEVLRTKMGP